MAFPSAARVKLVWVLELALGLELYACAVLVLHARGLKATPLLASPGLVIPALVIPPVFYVLVGLVSVRPLSPWRLMAAVGAMCGIHAVLVVATGALFVIPDLVDYGAAVAFSLWGSPAVTMLQLTAAPLVLARLRPLLALPRSAPRRGTRASSVQPPAPRPPAATSPPAPRAPSAPVVEPSPAASAVRAPALAPAGAPTSRAPVVTSREATPFPIGFGAAPRAAGGADTGRPAAASTEPMVRVSFNRIADQLPVEMFLRGRKGLNDTMRPGVSLLVPRRMLLPHLAEGVAPVKWDVVADQFPRDELKLTHEEIRSRLPDGSLLLPLDEVMPQIPAELRAHSTPAVGVLEIEERSPEPATVADRDVWEAERPETGTTDAAAPEQPIASTVVPDAAVAAHPMSAASVSEAGALGTHAAAADATTADVETADLETIDPETADPQTADAATFPVSGAEALGNDTTTADAETADVETAGGATAEEDASSETEAPEIPVLELAAPEIKVQALATPLLPAPRVEELELEKPECSEPERQEAEPRVDVGASGGRTAEAGRIAALLAPLMSGLEIGERTEAGTPLVTVVAPPLSEDAVVATAGRILPWLADGRLSEPVSQATLTAAEAAIVLTPFGSPEDGALLVTAVSSRASLARLERLSRSAAGEHGGAMPNGIPRPGSPRLADELRVTVVPPSVRELATSLTAFGPVTPSVLRDTIGLFRICLFLPGSINARPLAQLSRDLYRTLEGAEIGRVASVDLQLKTYRLVMRAVKAPSGETTILVGRASIARPGLARIELDRAAARLSTS